MRTNWIARLARSRLASSPRSFDMLGGASSLSSSSSVVVRSFVGCFFVLASSSVVLSVSRAVAVSLCLACLGACLSCGRFLSVPPSCLLAIRSALSSYRSAPRSFDMRGGADTAWSRLGRCCLLLAVAVLRGVEWRFPSPPLLAVWPFYRVGVVLSCRPLVLACLPSSSLVVCGSWCSRYRLRSCLASSPLLASPRRRRGVVMG